MEKRIFDVRSLLTILDQPGEQQKLVDGATVLLRLHDLRVSNGDPTASDIDPEACREVIDRCAAKGIVPSDNPEATFISLLDSLEKG